MGFDSIFVLELLLVAPLVLGPIIGDLYLGARNRGGGERVDPYERLYVNSKQRAKADPHEFYKRTSLENDEDIKMHLYSVDEYEKEFRSIPSTSGAGRFVAALKSYRPVGDEWFDFAPERAARVLDLSPQDYEVDGEHGILLLRKLPHGLPTEARDIL